MHSVRLERGRQMRGGLYRQRCKITGVQGWNFCPRRRVFPVKRIVDGRFKMLGWALTFLVIALISAVLGFGGIAGMSMEIAKIIFFVAIVLFAISAIVGLFRGRSPTVP